MIDTLVNNFIPIIEFNDLKDSKLLVYHQYNEAGIRQTKKLVVKFNT